VARASETTSRVFRGGTWKTPKPSCGMRASPRSGMVGTRLVDRLMDSSCPLRAGPNGPPGRGRGITRALVRVDPRPSPVRSPAGRLPDADDLVRRLPRPGICAAVYGGSILILLLSHLGDGWGFVDLTIYRYGGQAALRGAHLYALRFPGALAVTYPPLAALLFTGLTVPSMAVLRPLLTAGDLLLLPAMLGFALRLAP